MAAGVVCLMADSAGMSLSDSSSIERVPSRPRKISPAYVRRLRNAGASKYAIEFAQRHITRTSGVKDVSKKAK